jgi:hypothetical protein
MDVATRAFDDACAKFRQFEQDCDSIRIMAWEDLKIAAMASFAAHITLAEAKDVFAQLAFDFEMDAFGFLIQLE